MEKHVRVEKKCLVVLSKKYNLHVVFDTTIEIMKFIADTYRITINLPIEMQNGKFLIIYSKKKKKK